MTSQFSTYVIAEPCIGVKNGICLEVCPVDCIHSTEEEDRYYIDPEVCIACEQCALVCPVEAIFLDIEVPDRWQSFAEKMPITFAVRRGSPCRCPLIKPSP